MYRCIRRDGNAGCHLLLRGRCSGWLWRDDYLQATFLSLELLLYLRHLLRPCLHLSQLEAWLVGAWRKTLRFSGGLRNPAISVGAIRPPDILLCPSFVFWISLRGNTGVIHGEYDHIQLRASTLATRIGHGSLPIVLSSLQDHLDLRQYCFLLLQHLQVCEVLRQTPPQGHRR